MILKSSVIFTPVLFCFILLQVCLLFVFFFLNFLVAFFCLFVCCLFFVFFFQSYVVTARYFVHLFLHERLLIYQFSSNFFRNLIIFITCFLCKVCRFIVLLNFGMQKSSLQIFPIISLYFTVYFHLLAFLTLFSK